MPDQSDGPGRYDGPGLEVAPDVVSLRCLIANVCMIGKPGTGDRLWTLVDTGLANSDLQIMEAAAARFGPGSRPHSIILTHGHFDHVGAAATLSEHWDVPIYAHRDELPYVTGQQAYPPPDPSVGGGLLAAASLLFPRGPVDLTPRIRPLPDDGSVPGLPDWRWLHTPGHTPGHISLFRPSDRTLVAGDAFITVRQESALAVLLQEKQIHGPPMYFTPDWPAARQSVRRLEALRPRAVVPGHGLPMWDEELRDRLTELAAEFNTMAVPEQGRYVPDELR